MRGSDGKDMIIMSGEALRRIYGSEATILGSGALVIWYNAGKAIGVVDGNKFVSKVSTIGIQDLAKNLSQTYSRMGWGRIECGEFDFQRNELSLRLYNSPMVRGITSKEPTCWFVRGFVEGLASAILGTEVAAAEIACEAVWGDHW